MPPGSRLARGLLKRSTGLRSPLLKSVSFARIDLGHSWRVPEAAWEPFPDRSSRGPTAARSHLRVSSILRECAGGAVPRNEKTWDDDNEIVQAILGGSVEHFNLLYNAYFPRVYRFALKRLRDPAEAEDVTQEVFLTVFRVLGSYRGNSSLLVWIFGITRNTVNRRFRRARPRMASLSPSTRYCAYDRSV